MYSFCDSIIDVLSTKTEVNILFIHTPTLQGAQGSLHDSWSSSIYSNKNSQVWEADEEWLIQDHSVSFMTKLNHNSLNLLPLLQGWNVFSDKQLNNVHLGQGVGRHDQVDSTPGQIIR